jgi:hypothetical protein
MHNNIVDNVVIWDGGGDLFQGTTNIHLGDDERCETPVGHMIQTAIQDLLNQKF